MFRYKLERIRLNDGTEFAPGALTVIVGPNNSGKSRLLEDIKDICTSNAPNPVVATGVEHSRPSSAQELVESYPIRPRLMENQPGNIGLSLLNADMDGIHQVPLFSAATPSPDQQLEDTVQIYLSNWEANKSQFAYTFGTYFIHRLTTESRLTITKSRNQYGQGSFLVKAFYDDGSTVETKLDAIFDRAFELHIKLDYSHREYLCLRVSREGFDNVPDDPRDAQPLLENYRMLDDEGDGLRSFCATILALLVGQRPVLLLDEPEAFLHPPQAVHLGEEIAELASSERQVFVSTHSVDLLRGILNKRADVEVIRLSRRSDQTSATRLTVDEVKEMSSDPLLTSTRVLDGLFYKGVVVVEGDADSAFYQRVARTMRSGDEIHYTHAHNKQTLYKVAGPYKNMGVPLVAIADFDVLREEPDFQKLLTAMTDRPIERVLDKRTLLQNYIESQPVSEKLREFRDALQQIVDDSTVAADRTEAEVLADVRRRTKRTREEARQWSAFKKAGREALDEEHKRIFDEVSDFCKQQGLFIVPVGELESWLTEFGIEPSSNKNAWIVRALETLPEIDLTSSKLATWN